MKAGWRRGNSKGVFSLQHPAVFACCSASAHPEIRCSSTHEQRAPCIFGIKLFVIEGVFVSFSFSRVEAFPSWPTWSDLLEDYFLQQDYFQISSVSARLEAVKTQVSSYGAESWNWEPKLPPPAQSQAELFIIAVPSPLYPIINKITSANEGFRRLSEPISQHVHVPWCGETDRIWCFIISVCV